MSGSGEMEVIEGKVEGETGRRCACVVGYITLLTAHAAGGEWDVAQPALSIGGLQGGDRWWREDGASPQGSVGGFITPCAAPVLYFSEQESGKTAIKHTADTCRSSDKDCPHISSSSWLCSNALIV